MKAYAAAAAIMFASPASATEMLVNGGFDGPAASTSLTGQYQFGAAAASGWSVWNNTDAATSTALVASFEGRSNVLHISTTDAQNGAFQKMYAWALSGSADIWVEYGQAMFLAVRDDFGYKYAITSNTGAWEHLSLNTPLPFNEVTFYSWGGAASFYVANASATSQPLLAVAAPIPEPATWAMMMLGFGAMGAALRRRQVQPVKLCIRYL